ncbi:SAV_915 family protein [Streptomyces sp. NPDC097619]|uniref:SAV_915 family protein n=1 Tax=Streptomyces sp. NPDC097619 TaxID=3157228 RepID=UPI00332BA3B3
MCLFQYEDDPEPEERVPAGLLHVPVRSGTREVVLRMFRTPLGARTAVGFTDPERLAATLGAGQPWIRLSASALRAMAEPLGAVTLTVDPTLTAPPVAGTVAGVPSVPAGASAVVTGATGTPGSASTAASVTSPPASPSDARRVSPESVRRERGTAR